MPGSFGSSPTEDGVAASTSASDKFGVFGRNDGTSAPSPGSAGGAGVFGLTVVPKAAGVFGANNNPSAGVGVQGNGPEAGVSGFSESGAGVLAHSNHGDAVQAFAHDSTRNGLLASNVATGTAPTSGPPAGNGLLAVTTVAGGVGAFGACNHPSKGRGIQGNGPEAGVSGFSESGAGVLAHSNHGDAVQAFAHDSTRNGILGHNNSTAPAPSTGAPAGNGVFGFTEVPNASGVCGAIGPNNTSGAGVTGVGKTAGRFFGDLVVTAQITCGKLAVGGQDVIANQQLISTLQQEVNSLRQQVTNLQQQVTNLQQQSASLQQTHAQDVQGIAVSLATLAARVTALGG